MFQVLGCFPDAPIALASSHRSQFRKYVLGDQLSLFIACVDQAHSAGVVARHGGGKLKIGEEGDHLPFVRVVDPNLVLFPARHNIGS
jgi:hypothetical protein